MSTPNNVKGLYTSKHECFIWAYNITVSQINYCNVDFIACVSINYNVYITMAELYN